MVTQNGGDYDDDETAVEQVVVVEEEEIPPTPNKWSWLDFTTISLCFVRNAVQNVAGYVDSLARQVNEHHLYRSEHVDFADSVMKDVSKL